jgi:UPF0716 protein FxsA
VIGTWRFRRDGRRAWEALRQAIGQHPERSKEVADGALVVLGGALMLAPGFVTDAVGVLCVLPPTRAVLRRVLTGWLAGRLLGPVAGPRTRRGRRHDVIEGEVVDDP